MSDFFGSRVESLSAKAQGSPERIAIPLGLGLGIILLSTCVLPAAAQLQVLPDAEPQRVFSGQTNPITVLIRNSGALPVSVPMRIRLYQADSATAIFLGESAWKQLNIAAQQTVLDSAPVEFPAVRAETPFVIQWLAGTNAIIGTTRVLAYPTNLMRELNKLAADQAIGVFDPQGQFISTLKSAGVACSDLASTGLDKLPGKLAIVGPFHGQVPKELADRLRHLAEKGAAIVWIQAPPNPDQPLKPSFYTLPEGNGTVVVADEKLVAKLSVDPLAQLHLVELCRLALNPILPALPVIVSQS